MTQINPSTYTVTVSNAGDGTLGLNLNAAGTGIADLESLGMSSGFTGQIYTVDHTAPLTTVTGITLSSDTGVSATDFATTTARQTISGNLN
ncbi:hypothetical protein ACO0LB_20585, partial [Undibacterium sp. SXout7W]|uniref:hypothetical protein n=1 Tax=Undibacterium sp. SXout7W TaxID=3413049 RepID=UPI003BF36C66